MRHDSIDRVRVLAHAAVVVFLAWSLVQKPLPTATRWALLLVLGGAALALVYALMNFIGTIAVMKFTRFGDLAGMEDDEEEEIL